MQTAARDYGRAIWTPDMVRDRLAEAGFTLHRQMIYGLRPASAKAWWPDIVRDPREAYGYTEEVTRLALPGPREIARADEAFDWVCKHVPDITARKVAMARSICRPSGKPRLSYRFIGKHLGVSDETARQWHLQALADISRALSGL